MPPKRSNPSCSADVERPAKKAAAGTTKAAAPKLKKSTAPNWYQNSEYFRDKPTTEWGKKCVDRWCLLPPYNTSISEKQWKTYYLERSALDKVNSKGSEESKEIVSEELGQDTWVILRRAAGNIAAAIYGSSLDEETKKAIGRTLLGSLYFTDLWGNDEGDGSPREVCAKTRLYSPFGLGTSIDFYYRYYYRVFSIGQRFSSLYAIAKTVSDCNAENPRACTATKLNANQVEKAAPDAITLFDRNNKKSKGTTPANIKTFEEPLFGCEGWLSPLKLVNILFAAGTVLHYKEGDRETPRSVLAKLNFFQGESDGQNMLKQELVKLKGLEEDQEGGGVCVPQSLLSLARQEETTEAGPNDKETSEKD